MTAQYHCCAAEVQIGRDREESVNAAKKSFTAANAIASADVEAAHPYRTRLALDYALFTRNLLGESIDGIRIATQAYEEGVKEIVDKDGVSAAAKDALRDLGDNLELMKSRDLV